MKKLLLVLLLVCPACACGDDNNSCEDIENIEVRQQCLEGRNPTAPTPNPIARFYTVEYRVIGTTHRAKIVYASTIHGTTELVTGLPWFASFRTNNDRVFVSLYARAEDIGTVRVQILVDGVLFREASTDGFFGTEVEVSGTFIHPDQQTIESQSNASAN